MTTTEQLEMAEKCKDGLLMALNATTEQRDESKAENARLREALEYIRDNGMSSTKEAMVKWASDILANAGVSKPDKL